MPSKASWDGHWSGEGRPYVIVKTLFKKYYKGYPIDKILEQKDFYYTWNDGWTACVTAKRVDSKTATKLRSESVGFYGYDWMVESILKIGRIDRDYRDIKVVKDDTDKTKIHKKNVEPKVNKTENHDKFFTKLANPEYISGISVSDLLRLTGGIFEFKKIDYYFTDLSGDGNDSYDKKYFLVGTRFIREHGEVVNVKEYSGTLSGDVRVTYKDGTEIKLWLDNEDTGVDHYRISSNPVISPVLTLVSDSIVSVPHGLLDWLRGLSKYGLPVSINEVSKLIRGFPVQCIYTWENLKIPKLVNVNGRVTESLSYSYGKISLTTKEISEILNSISDATIKKKVYVLLYNYDSMKTDKT